MEIKIIKDILEPNDQIAKLNREKFDHHKVKVVNIMSAPGAGKTTFLERLCERLAGKVSLAIIEGDIQTTIDAERLERFQIPIAQINTGGACHLDANMIANALNQLDLEPVQLLLIENVGNLVCPAEFKLGQDFNLMLLSAAEGDDKPKKYPLMFHSCRALVINKIDLLPYVNFDLKKAAKDSLEINPSLEIFEISCKTGEGLDRLIDWLMNHLHSN